MENELRGEDDPDKRDIIKKQMWAFRKKVQAEKKKEQMAHILRNLRAGGWKKALQAKVVDMTQMRIDEKYLTTDEAVIADYATKYYSDLFETVQNLRAPAQEREDRLQALLHRDFLDTDFTGWATASMAERALGACPKRNTCAASNGVVT